MKNFITVGIGYTLVVGAIFAWHYWHVNSALTGVTALIGLVIISVSALDLLE
jgi:hypothetical protein